MRVSAMHLSAASTGLPWRKRRGRTAISVSDVEEEHRVLVDGYSVCHIVSTRPRDKLRKMWANAYSPSDRSLPTRAGVPTAMDTLLLARNLTCSGYFMCLANS